MDFTAELPDEVELILSRSEITKEIVVDIECSHPVDAYAVDIWRPGWYLEGIAIASDESALYIRDPWISTLLISRIWESSATVIGHNIKFDLMGLKKFDLVISDFPENIADTMIAQNLLDENLKGGMIGLKPTVKRLLGIDMMDFAEVGSDKESSAFAEYAADDARNTLLLWQHFKPQLEEEGLLELFNRVHMPMVKVCAEMELFGFRWDAEVGEELIAVYADKQQQLHQDLCEEFGEVINLNSGDQISKKLFTPKSKGGMGVPTGGISKTKSGKRYSVDKDSLEKLAADYPICSVLKDYRHATDMLTKYLMKMSRFSLDDPKGRTHATTWLISATGRTRQQNPPNQTIPKTTQFYVERGGEKDFAPYTIRRGFKAAPGRVLMKADFSQFQLRLCAHVTRDPSMTKAFTHWQCTACSESGDSITLLLSCPKCGELSNEDILKNPSIRGFWHGLDLHQMTYEVCSDVMDSRQDGKTANFALIFMASARRMHIEYPKFSIREWEKIIYDFFYQYKGVKKYHEALERTMDAGGEVRDIFGRKRRISKDEIRRSRKHALNQIVNFPIQAAEVHYAFLCCSEIREKLIKEHLWNYGEVDHPGCGIVHFMHDEIIIDAPNNSDVTERVGQIMLNTMRHRVVLNVPVNAELEIGESW